MMPVATTDISTTFPERHGPCSIDTMQREPQRQSSLHENMNRS